ncbi:FKBP-type peptidyl-prolyl cis-trans isomerase [Sphingomonas sp.]|uniref:FKBP-type peptidyl-prolyl cis-trans isomerase n=1 Tax=Sphingomonas sp. TaxID=28214 RepID=UPI0025E612CA|nr:FKBP-type peptidyl-prolyl cis-trans isomerase [Sphingomonas sp.]
MSVTQVPLRPVAKGTLVMLWLAIAALIALAYGVAYMGAGQFRSVTIETVAAGKGPLITEQDAVLIEFTGRTADGQVFGSTEGQDPAAFMVSQLVPGMKQAVTQMQEGGRYKILVPGRLAYDKDPTPGAPRGDLTFDIHVVQVVPNAALQMGAAQQQQQQPPPQQP